MVNLPRDPQGYLLDWQSWSKDVAKLLAEEKKITLSEQHWKIIDFVRGFYEQYKLTPAARIYKRFIEKDMNTDLSATTVADFLTTLFPPDPAKTISFIAGLPRPTRCI